MKLRRSKLARASVSIADQSRFGDGKDPYGDGEESGLVWKETPLDDVLRREVENALDASISKLPPAYRAVFLLRDVEDRSAKETAKILGLSVAAVKSRLHRARSFLRNELNPYMSS